MIACGKNKICHIIGCKFPGIGKVVECNISGSQIITVYDRNFLIFTFCVNNTIDILLTYYILFVFQISGGPNHIVIRNSDVHHKMAEIIIKLLGTSIGIIVPTIYIIIYSDPGEKICNKKTGAVNSAGPDMRTL